MNRRHFIQQVALLSAAGVGMPKGSSGVNFSAAGKRVGIVGLDTGHSEIFAKLINQGGDEMKGYKVVAAYPHGSKDIESALKRKPDIIKAVQEMGVEIVGSIDELLGKVDVVLLESNDGRVHLQQALPVFKAHKRVFIDKPVAASLAEAISIFRTAERYNTPVFSSSALRFDVNVQKVVLGSVGAVTGADVYTPGDMDKGHLDLAWYAIHGVEMLFAVMGAGCKTVSRTFTEGADLITGVWYDGRIGTVRAIRKGASGIAGVAFGERGIAQLGPFSDYGPLVEQIVAFFESGMPPVSPSETIEIFKFMNAAQESKVKNGATIDLA